MEIDAEPPDLVDVSLNDAFPSTTGSAIPLVAELPDLAVSKVPLTIITGYLGSGKTTLVNHILNAQHGKKIAVILNEFGDSTVIEQRAINVTDVDSSQSIDFLTLGNGCICCSVKDAGLNAIEQLLERHAATPGNKPFDAIVLETSGLADPGGIVPGFWSDEGLGSSVRLDGVVTVVDAGNLLRSLDELTNSESASTDQKCEMDPHETVAHLQISGADSIILNKVDQVTSTAQLQAVEARIRSINAAAKTVRTSYGAITELEGRVLGLQAYDHFDPAGLQGRPHSHLDPAITTLTLSIPTLTPSQVAALDRWLQSLLWENILPPPSTACSTTARTSGEKVSFSIYRTKGLFRMTDRSERMVQGVREVFEITEPATALQAGTGTIPGHLDKQDDGGENEGKLVFIGRGLDKKGFEESVYSALEQTDRVSGPFWT